MPDIIIVERWDRRYGRRRAIITAESEIGKAYLKEHWDFTDDENCVVMDAEFTEEMIKQMQDADLIVESK